MRRVFVVLALLAAMALRSQVTAGSAAVGGTVVDSTGAAIPGAKILLTETARGLVRETVANSAGAFLFPALASGIYSLAVTKEAFDAYEMKNIPVEVGQL